VGQSALRGNHGDRDRRRRLANYSHARTSRGEIATVHGFAAETSAALIIQAAAFTEFHFPPRMSSQLQSWESAR